MASLSKNQINLEPHYIVGFVDGEGCFGMQYRKDVRHERPGAPTYYSWKLQFMITARKDEISLFERIKEYFGCGNIYDQQNREIHYAVTNLDDLKNTISPFFRKFSLQGKKKYDFALWDEALEIICKNKKKKVNVENGKKGFSKSNWSKEDFSRLLEIHSAMQKYKSQRPIGLKHIGVAHGKF